MASDVSEKMKPVMDFYARWSKDSFDMISKGMAMYNKMSATWMDVAEGSPKEKADDPLQKWGEAFSGAYNELFEMYTHPLKMFGTSPAPGKEVWENAFAGWQKMFSATPAASAPPLRMLLILWIFRKAGLKATPKSASPGSRACRRWARPASQPWEKDRNRNPR